MEAITKYKAADGAEFRDADACIAHEALCAEIAGIMSTLPAPPKDDDCRFANGHGYYQHDAAQFAAARKSLLLIANRISPHQWFDQSLARDTVHPSWAGRIIDEISAPLSRAWYRIMCTDKNMREWGQPYYANNPANGDQGCLNPEAPQ